MVLLQVVTTFISGLENTVVVNTAVEELKPYSEVIITKSNGTRRQFRLIMNSDVPMNCFVISDAESCKYRLHMNHKYHVECVKSSIMVTKKPVVHFSQMKIAGYSSAIEQIVQRVFRPRKLSIKLRKKFNIRLIRGVILHGPPGTGKTTLVKAVCEYFKLEPRIINGPELFTSFGGNSEKAVRQLFIRATKDQKEKGDSSPLHVFVFEEMDALFSKRTSSVRECGSEIRNSVVSQLLSIIDGHTKLDNILIFGTTSRLDMIDPSVFCASRFELQIKMDLPNVQDRLEIINFHLKKLRENGRMASDISVANLKHLANATENFSGADLSQIVRFGITEATKRVLRGPIMVPRKS